MTYISTISTKGQVTIPDPIRQALSIQPGDRVFFNVESVSKRQLKMRVNKHYTLKELAGSLHIPGMKYIPLAEARKKLAKTQIDESWI